MAKLLLLAWKNYKLAIQQKGQKSIREENYRKPYNNFEKIKMNLLRNDVDSKTYYFQHIIQSHNFHLTLGHL